MGLDWNTGKQNGNYYFGFHTPVEKYVMLGLGPTSDLQNTDEGHKVDMFQNTSVICYSSYKRLCIGYDLGISLVHYLE